MVRRMARTGSVALSFWLLSCGKGGAAGEPTAPSVSVLSTITVAVGTATVAVGQSTIATASGMDQHGAPVVLGAVAWTVSPSTVASVNTNGVVTAVSAGQATVVATSGGTSGQQLVTVIPAPVANISVTPTPASVVAGATLQLAATLRDASGVVLTGRNILWSSSDSAKAVVSDGGLVTGLVAGSATVSASSEGKVAAALVTVMPAPPVLTRIDNFTANSTATLYGRALRATTALRVESTVVALLAVSDTSVSFTVPRLRACETDGRPVTVTLQANGLASLSARIRVPTSLSMQPGQSWVLAADTLSCLQLPAANQDFVLTVLNPQVPEDRTASTPWPPAIVDLLRFQTGPTGASSAAAQVPVVALLPASDARGHEDFVRQMMERSAVATSFTANPTPFDPKYATAAIGDVIRLPVVWKLNQLQQSGQTPTCSRDRVSVRADTALSYAVQVVAISDFVVVGVDMRLPNVAQYLSANYTTFFRAVAEAAAPYIVPAARNVFDAGYTPMTGGGGRHYVVFTTNQLYDPTRVGAWSGIAGDVVTEMPQATCALSSEMHTVFLGTEYFSPAQGVAWPASIVIHEFAHQAESKVNNGQGATSGQPEQWAVNAQEVAMRLALGQPVEAHYNQLGAAQATESQVLSTTWARLGAPRLWDPTASYAQAALFVHLLREWGHDDGLTPSSRTFYQRTVGKYDWRSFRGAINAQAAELGMTATDLLDRYVLASATDNLVDAAAASSFQLPQIRSWDSRTFPGTPASVSRTTPVQMTFSAGPGGYGAAYFMAFGSTDGVSLAFTQLSKLPVIIRITRLR